MIIIIIIIMMMIMIIIIIQVSYDIINRNPSLPINNALDVLTDQPNTGKGDLMKGTKLCLWYLWTRWDLS